jgi:hypothetical protein
MGAPIGHRVGRRRPQPHPTAAVLADRTFGDQLDPGSIERGDHLHQRIHIAADHPVAGLHALDRGHRQPRQRGQLALIDAEQGARAAQLGRDDHSLAALMA